MHVLAKLGSNFIILLLSLVADLGLNVCGRVSLPLSGLYAYVTVSECSKRMLVSPKLLRRRFSSLLLLYCFSQLTRITYSGNRVKLVSYLQEEILEAKLSSRGLFTF